MSEAAELGEIEAFLEFFHRDFTRYYAYAIGLAETLPQQVNNEIRNAVSHLSRAHVSQNTETRQSEARKATAHLERACRDCLKVALLAVVERVKKHIDATNEKYAYITRDIASLYKECRNKHEQLVINEAHASLSDEELRGRYEGLLTQWIFLEQKILKEYDDVSAYRQGLIRKFRKILVAVITSFLGGLIVVLLPPGVLEFLISLRNTFLHFIFSN